MTQDRPSRPLERLVPAVGEFETEHFHLKEDLDHLDKVRRVDAPEAVILYCARILEALAAAALRTVKLEPSPNVYANLDALQQYNLLPTATRHWAHALRRAGNLVRHIRSRVQPGDAELAVLFVERWLDWFFRTFRYGHQLPSLTRDGEPLGLGASASLRALLGALEDLDQNLHTVLRHVHAGLSGDWLQTPALPAALAEMLLDCGRHADARTVLDAALKEFPDDLRLRLFLGLYWSRTGNLEESLRCLEPLHEQYKDDDQAAGITAGVYKRRWLQDPSHREWLEKSQRAYRQGWERSKKMNAYLGINAATTALWLGRPAESRQVAEEVRRLLNARIAALAERLTDPDLQLNYWDQVTLAEAEMLLGDLAAARRHYRAAFATHAEQQRANIEVSQKQLGEVLRLQGISDDVSVFLGRPLRTATQRPVIVGVTGHRRLPRDKRLHRRLHDVLTMIRQAHFRDRGQLLVALSGLAEGTDRLVTELILSPEIGGSLHVVLPLEAADYRTDFVSEESQREFQALLDRAEVIRFPPPRPPAVPERGQRSAARAAPSSQEEREAAYAWGGQYVVDHCDVLMALWDGEPARGPGGTAEVVAYARQVGRPLLWIRTIPPYELIAERLEKPQA
jgi:tetratricopeptide (TPR) repeat protein